MGKRSRTEDASDATNPFLKVSKTKKSGQAEVKAQHTIKYYLWELLREQPEGLSVGQLLHEMESRKMRSFANSSKPASQLSVELNRDKEHFTQNAVSKLWSLRGMVTKPSKKPPKGAPSLEIVSHADADMPPKIQQEPVTAVASPRSPLAEQAEPGAQREASQIAASDSAPVGAHAKEQHECGASAAVKLTGSPKLEAGPHSVAVASHISQVPARVVEPKGASQLVMSEQPVMPDNMQAPADPTPKPSSYEAVATQQTKDGDSPRSTVEPGPQLTGDFGTSHSNFMQPPEQAQGAWSEKRKAYHPGQSAKANFDASPGAAAESQRFVLSPSSGVLKALDSSPASPISDLAAQDMPASWQELASSALSGSRLGASPLRPPAQLQTTGQQPAVVPGLDAANMQFNTCSQQEHACQRVSDEQVLEPISLASAHASGDGRAPLNAVGSEAAHVNAKPATGVVVSEDMTAVTASGVKSEDPLAPVCLGDAEEDPSLPEDTAVRWAPSPEWANPYGGLAEQSMSGKESSAAPLLGTLPQWPFRTLFPATPERAAPGTLRALEEAQPALAADERPPWPPDLMEASYNAPLLPDCRPVQPVQLLEDGEHPLPGSAVVPHAAATPSSAALPHGGLFGAGPEWPYLPPGGLPDCLSPVPTKEPNLQLPAVKEVWAPAADAQASLEQSKKDASEDLRESIRATILAQEPKRGLKQPSRELALDLRTSDRVQHDSQRHSSEPEREGRHRGSADRGGQSGRREGGTPDKYDRQHESRRGIDAERETKRDRDREHERDRERERGRQHEKDREREREREQERDRERRSSRNEDTGKDRHKEHLKDDRKWIDRHGGGHQDKAHADGRHHSRKDDYRDDYRDVHCDSRRRDSNEERWREAGHRSRDVSRQDDRSREARRSQGRDATREREREEERGPSRHASMQPRSRSGTRDSATPDDDWPFDTGRIIACSEAAAADCLARMKFGSDIRKDLEGIDKRTALFLWNYEREKLHGIFYGSSSKDVQETTSRKDIFLYEVRVHEFAHYHSLPLKIVGRIIPGNGTTQQGRHLLKTRIDRFRVVKLCREFARNHGGH